MSRADMERPATTDSPVQITVEHEGWSPGTEAVARRAALAALAGRVPPGRDTEISLLLTGDREVAGLNQQYRNRLGPTNVLSFVNGPDAAAPGAPLLLGDIVVAYETTASEALAEGKSIEDHLAHLVVHGVLHLLGFDHVGDGPADRMEGVEAAILKGMGISNPYDAGPGEGNGDG